MFKIKFSSYSKPYEAFHTTDFSTHITALWISRISSPIPYEKTPSHLSHLIIPKIFLHFPLFSPLFHFTSDTLYNHFILKKYSEVITLNIFLRSWTHRRRWKDWRTKERKRRNLETKRREVDSRRAAWSS